jgi:RNA polymerase sigma-70 factor (ECF subfamily)
VNNNDRQLIADSLAGRTPAFGELIRRYQDRLFNAVLRVVDNGDDAADVVQDAFLNAYQSLNSFKGDSEFFTWLYRIAFNAAISLKRKRKAVLSLDRGIGDVLHQDTNLQVGLLGQTDVRDRIGPLTDESINCV